ncbi:TetR/AcrR family transcriptional regulator [Streptacidiphilus sp. EB129]|uniref:TetR/AcrR family transcriptional regulator n=1 Tax=Streptacidiphilus sp. EB129 TaxID=3156262 RepID=UPI0035181EBB
MTDSASHTPARAPRPPRPMRADARRNYERLVTVATEAFLEHGTDASLDDIAKRAGVGPGTLYRHFPTRQQLIDAVLEQWIQSVLADAEPLLGADDPAEALSAWLHRLVSHVSVFRGLAAALLPPLPKSKSPGWVLHSTAGELFERAQASGRIRPDVEVGDVLVMISGITWACDSGKTVNADRLVDLIMDGLRTGAPRPGSAGQTGTGHGCAATARP